MAPKEPESGRRALVSDGPRMGGNDNDGNNGEDSSSSGGPTLIGADCFLERTKSPDWIKEREAVYDTIAARRAEELEAKTPTPISVTMPDGNVLTVHKKTGVPFTSWTTTPYDVAVSISQGLADSSVVARITYADYVADYDPKEDGVGGKDIMEEDDGGEEEEEEEDASAFQCVGEEKVGGDAATDDCCNNDAEDPDNNNGNPSTLWDLNRPLVGNVAKLEFLKFDDDTPDAKTVYWHSSAHILGEALEHLYGSKLTIGPPLASGGMAGGFYYDSYMGTGPDAALKEEDLASVQQEVNKIAKSKQKFERMVVTKDEALELFVDNPFKKAIISTKVPDGTRTTVYKCGDLIDLCRGPHIMHTGKVKAFSTTQLSATNWLGDTNRDSLQRIYGISFPDKKLLKTWKENIEKAKERDHRRIMTKQNLVMFHDLSPGSAFWLPHGTRIYNKLVDFIKMHYWKRDFDEVITPNVFNLDLWHQSGHALHYKENMFVFDVEGKEWAMKPMNCPAHCLMFGSDIRSYRDLPIRYGDFGVLHRNELSGALTGLTRVRRFQQDDGHIFCREDQIEDEVCGALDFMQSVYNTFGMTYKLELSTRPKKALGEKGLWDLAEAALARAMDTFAGKGGWKVNPGDGAFYGPKIDIKVTDAMDRVHQCATIQLDFQLPIRFDLRYTTESKEKGEQFARPVIVHRAVLGSVERMFAVLCEHYGGKWPLWLSPRQVMIVPVHSDWNEYCQQVRKKLREEGFHADVDLSKETFKKKVRNAQIAQYNLQLVVGQQEVTNGSVNIRTRENKVEGEMKVEDFMIKIKKMRDEHQ